MPTVKYLGILPKDIEKYQIPKKLEMSLDESNYNKIQDLWSKIYMKENPMWTQQLDDMFKNKIKVEIESLGSLLETYLSTKIQSEDWIHNTFALLFLLFAIHLV